MTTLTNDTFLMERMLLPDHQLADIHRAEMRACLDQHPENPFGGSHPLHTLSEEHRKEWILRVENRSKIEAVEKRAEAREARQSQIDSPELRSPEGILAGKKTQAIAAREILCKDCGVVISRTGKRGRPPTRCESCREIFEAAQAPETERECGACRRGGRGKHLNTCQNKGKTTK